MPTNLRPPADRRMCVVKRIRAAVWPPLSKPAVPAWLSTGAL